MRSVFVLIAWVFLIAGAQAAAESESDLLWVGRHYQGGRQCQAEPSQKSQTPPDTGEIFKENNIEIVKEFKAHDDVCRACGCPAYSFTHFVLIRKKDASRVLELGFKEMRIPKEYEIVREKEMKDSQANRKSQ